MSHQPRSPVWPFLFVLSCLFVLSVTAPRNWERIARKSQPHEPGGPQTAGPDAAGTVVAGPAPEPRPTTTHKSSLRFRSTLRPTWTSRLRRISPRPISTGPT